MFRKPISIDRRQPRDFVTLPVAVFDFPLATIQTLACLIRSMDRNGFACVSIPDISANINASERSVKTALAQLKEAKLIIVTRRPNLPNRINLAPSLPVHNQWNRGEANCPSSLDRQKRTLSGVQKTAPPESVVSPLDGQLTAPPSTIVQYVQNGAHSVNDSNHDEAPPFVPDIDR